MIFFLCRHGETDWNKDRVLQGRSQSQLNQTGIAQAEKLASIASKWNIDLVVSSPLDRAKTTAQICAKSLSLPMDIIDALAERNFADWQGQPISKLEDFIRFRQICYGEEDLRPVNGAETTRDVRNRFKTALLNIAQNYQNCRAALVVSHGDAIDCFISQYTHPQYLKNTEFVKVRFDKIENRFEVDALPQRELPYASF
jgi:probable phosphoglycerate mutase